MNAVHVFGADILEVGYAIRGNVSTAAHVDLWDTFSCTVTVTVDTSTNHFYRAQVCDPVGQIIGIGNPIWLPRQAPPSGIPGPRR